ncbi:MAG: AMIN domain-containing protein [Acidobacteriota bacterium]
MLGRALKAVPVSILILVAGLMVQSRPGIASGNPSSLPTVRAISIHPSSGGAVVIDVATTRAVHYRTFELSSPRRLVVDLNGAGKALLKSVYPSQSQLLERVRVGQWKSDPPILRIVADLKGTPAFAVHAKASGLRIELKPRAAAGRATQRSRTRRSQEAGDARGETSEITAQKAAKKSPFTVHRFEDLTASLTAPKLPPQDRLVPVTKPEASSPNSKESGTIALVSGISIKPEKNGAIGVNIASTRSVPYRVFQLADPFRLVVDLKDAREGNRRDVYPVDSPILKRIRVGQWRSNDPSVVRVVADLEGDPIFDVYARQPGIRIDLRPRHELGQLIRNPFEYATQHAKVRLRRLAAQPAQAMTAATNSPGAKPGTAFPDLKVIGYLEKQGSQTQAIISDHTNIYFVPQGGTIEDRFRVLSISANAVEIQDIQTLQTNWLAYTP